jgi:hypothetical protein
LDEQCISERSLYSEPWNGVFLFISFSRFRVFYRVAGVCVEGPEEVLGADGCAWDIGNPICLRVVIDVCKAQAEDKTQREARSTPPMEN